jgi:arylsulfatase A-like enzyme
MPHEALYWRLGQQKAVRHGHWKLVVSRPPQDGPEWRLFNLAEDIGEAKDLSAEHPEKVKELAALWDAWNAEQKDPLWLAPMNRPGQRPAGGQQRPNRPRRAQPQS